MKVKKSARHCSSSRELILARLWVLPEKKGGGCSLAPSTSKNGVGGIFSSSEFPVGLAEAGPKMYPVSLFSFPRRCPNIFPDKQCSLISVWKNPTCDMGPIQQCQGLGEKLCTKHYAHFNAFPVSLGSWPLWGPDCLGCSPMPSNSWPLCFIQLL
jgi:hypothetical protein